MSLRPTPLRSFIGGVGLSFPIHSLLVFNGSSFGVSGFIHDAFAGGVEAASGVFGIILGGLIIGLLEGATPVAIRSTHGQIVLSGLLVGFGSKLSNGCTSGHMLCGVSRFSMRSIAATLSFFVSGAITTLLVHGKHLPLPSDYDWTTGQSGVPLLSLKAAFLLMSTILHILVRGMSLAPLLHPLIPFLKPWDQWEGVLRRDPVTPSQKFVSVSSKRRLVTVFTGLDFAIALHLSNLTDANRVLAFLVLPIHRSFDPSLAFLAVGALPSAMIMSHSYRGLAYFGQKSATIVKTIDGRLLGGAALFGVGWGLSGVCPAPGLVNLGRVIAIGGDPSQFAVWLLGVIIGGRLVMLWSQPPKMR